MSLGPPPKQGGAPRQQKQKRHSYTLLCSRFGRGCRFICAINCKSTADKTVKADVLNRRKAQGSSGVGREGIGAGR